MSHINSSSISSVTPGTIVMSYITISSVDSPYTVLPTDQFIAVSTNTGPVIILFPDTPVEGRTYGVKDITNNAATNNITLTTVSGLDDIDGAATFIMNTDYQSSQLIFDGVNKYYIF